MMVLMKVYLVKSTSLRNVIKKYLLHFTKYCDAVRLHGFVFDWNQICSLSQIKSLVAFRDVVQKRKKDNLMIPKWSLFQQ